jgi:hypothetical protein
MEGQKEEDQDQGQQERQGNVLVLRDVKTSFELGFFSFSQTFDSMQLEAMPDGTVSVSYAPDMTMDFAITPPNGPAMQGSFPGTMASAHGVATGTADDYVFDFTAGELHQTGQFSAGTPGIDAGETTFDSLMKDLTSQIHVVNTDAGLNLDYTFAVGDVTNSQTTLVPGANGQSDSKQSQHSHSNGYTGNVALFLPPRGQSSGGSLIPEGLTLDARIEVAHSTSEQHMKSPALNMDLATDEGASTLSLKIDGQNIALGADSQDGTITVASSKFGPQPYSVTIADAGIALSLPYRPGDTPQDADFALNFNGITANDAVWALFDPENTLSRAPADFAIATSFNAQLLLDWTNTEAVKAWQGPPAILHRITLQDFLVGFENARVTGAGAVDFSTAAPVPMPNGGTLDFTFEGIPALLDKLGGLPLVDPGLIAGAQGMLGVFTSAGEGDTLTSEITFGEGGTVTVNGQRMR